MSRFLIFSVVFSLTFGGLNGSVNVISRITPYDVAYTNVDFRGYIDTENGRVYLDEDLDPITGWYTVEDTDRYLVDGIVQTGDTDINGNIYHLLDSGGYAADTIIGDTYYDNDGIGYSEYWTDHWYFKDGVKTEFNSNSPYGRFYIPDTGVDVGLQYINLDNCYLAQDVVDADDSAVYMDYGSSYVIADHRHQGFSAIKECAIGTKAFIRHDDRLEVYECVNIDPNSRNDGEDVYDSDENIIYNYDPSLLSCYTCNEDWQHVTVVTFKRL